MSRYNIKLKPLVMKGLESHRGNWPRIAAHAGVSYSTITHMMEDLSVDPKTSTMQALLDTLDAIEEGALSLSK